MEQFIIIRSYVVWICSAVSILGAFLYFVINGWPGKPSECVFQNPNTCYCEAFDLLDVEEGAPGVRQPVNTWSNLYSIITSGIVAYKLSQHRKRILQHTAHHSTTSITAHTPKNVMQSNNMIADMYVFVVLFLGLGSLWFHGSLTVWGGTVDGLSMYTFVAYLPWYTIRRLVHSDALFWTGYIGMVALFTYLGYAVLNSFVAVILCVGSYLSLECYIGACRGKCLLGMLNTKLLWCAAMVLILIATFFWWASHTGNFLCYPHSVWQPHGLVWHPLAGIVAVLLYYYWQEAEDADDENLCSKTTFQETGQDTEEGSVRNQPH